MSTNDDAPASVPDDRPEELRDAVGSGRDDAAQQRDSSGRRRDTAANRRDEAGARRDMAAGRRDEQGDERDLAADLRDRRDEHLTVAQLSLQRSSDARREAAADRESAARDRHAGAAERSYAHADRDTSLADRYDAASDRLSASMDGLTGAYLRGPGLVELRREAARARRTSQPLVVAFIDVDHLKNVNDSLGHAAGDRVLLAVTEVIRANLRSYDLLIRYGGDEFVCAIEGLALAEVEQRFSRVQAALIASAAHGSVTVGLADLRPDESIDDVILRADANLYEQRHEHPRQVYDLGSQVSLERSEQTAVADR